MSILKDTRLMNPIFCQPGDTLNVSYNNEVLVSEPMIHEMIVNRVIIYDDADLKYFKNGYRVEFGESR